MTDLRLGAGERSGLRLFSVFGIEIRLDVSVALSDSTGAPRMTFLVHGAAIDKRYADLDGVIRGVARNIAEEVQRASR